MVQIELAISVLGKLQTRLLLLAENLLGRANITTSTQFTVVKYKPTSKFQQDCFLILEVV